MQGLRRYDSGMNDNIMMFSQTFESFEGGNCRKLLFVFP